MPFQSQVHTDATKRLLSNVDALSGVFSFLAVNTAACFACADFFSAWHHITATADILRKYNRFQKIFQLWYVKEMKWFYKKKFPTIEREKTCDLIFHKYLTSHALAKALRCTIRFIAVERRLEESWQQYNNCNTEAHSRYWFVGRLKKYLPAVLKDWDEFYSPRAEYAHSPHAHTLSFLACWYLPFTRIAWSTKFPDAPHDFALCERPPELRMDIHCIKPRRQDAVICEHLRNAMKFGPASLDFFKFALGTFPDAFVYNDEYPDIFVEEFLPIVREFVHDRMKSIKSAKMVLTFWKRYHEIYCSFPRESHYPIDSFTQRAFLKDALPVLDKCLGGSPKLAKKAKIWLQMYQNIFFEHWKQVSRENNLKNILARPH